MNLVGWIGRIISIGWSRWALGWGFRSIAWASLAVALVAVTGCTLPQVSAEDRLFLPLAVDFLEAVNFPKQRFEGVPVGGLSALAYDRTADRFLALSDDRSNLGPARFYTFKISFKANDGGNGPADKNNGQPGFDQLAIEAVTTLKDKDGQPFATWSIDPEGLALSPRKTVFISSEGDRDRGFAPWIREFDRTTGQTKLTLPLPRYYLPSALPENVPGGRSGQAGPGSAESAIESRPSSGVATSQAPDSQEPDSQDQGIRNNLGFESLTIEPIGAPTAAGLLEPFRVFTAVEGSLAQDLLSLAERSRPDQATNAQDRDRLRRETAPRLRILHFLVGDGPPMAVSEHAYILEPPGALDLSHGLTDLTSIDRGGHFLSLERTYSPLDGFGAKLFQVALAGATDTAGFPSLRGSLNSISPARKRLLLDLGLSLIHISEPTRPY